MIKVYNFNLDINWKLINSLSQIDRFDASWNTIEKKEGQSLKQLKSIATVRSVGASTRIEGSKMSDEEVDLLLSDLSIDKLEDRDSQEVAGYFDVLNEISNSYEHIRITENELKGLHNQLLKYSQKDEWHKGDYKQHSNDVEAKLVDGTTQTVFQTTASGYETEDAMNNLVEWYINDNETHSIIKSAIFSYEFVSIHPFQDGNGRLSRLIASLLLLKNGYKWIQYVSFEHEIENRKPEYYRELRRCQEQRPNENITTWVKFFLGALLNIQEQLMNKLEQTGIESSLSPKEKSVLAIIANNPGCKSGTIAKKLEIPNPTIKKILKSLTDKNIIEKHSVGPGTNYTIY
jgi:Fic family protein